MRKLFGIAISAALASAACAQPAAEAQPKTGAPRLLVVISVDQFSADLFDEYRPHFTGGLARIAGGAAFHNGYQAHAATETCPGHSTILTSAHPARTRIIANTWVDQSVTRSDQTIYCAEDERVPGSSTISYTVSPMHLAVPTLGDLLKRQSPQSQNVTVAGKDRAAVMMGGHQVDQRWYWDGKKFSTDQQNSSVPATIQKANAALVTALATPRPPLEAPALCQGKSAPIAITPTLTVGPGRFARAAGDLRAFRASPEIDGAVLAIAAGMVQELRLGKDAAPDVLSVGLSATDYVGHAYGPGGGEMCLQLLTLDRELGDFLHVLDVEGIDYAVVLTADHGSLDIPERLRAKGIARAMRADPALATTLVGKNIGARLKLAGPVLLGDLGNDVFIDRNLTPSQRGHVEREAVAFYKKHRQVEAVFTKRQIERLPVPSGPPDKWTIPQRVRASFDSKRSGDLYVVLKEYVQLIATPGDGYVATHGSAWNYDRRVPILFWRKGMAPAPSDQAVDTVDIMPTLAAMIGLGVAPRSIDGACLPVQGAACPAR